MENKKILIIEDEKPIAEALKLKMESSGFVCKNAYDGEEAIALLSAEPFDVILLDIIMPKKDGLAVLAAMKERGDKTPVIVLSALDQEEMMKKAMDMGARDYIIKSQISIVDVAKYVNKYLENEATHF